MKLQYRDRVAQQLTESEVKFGISPKSLLLGNVRAETILVTENDITESNMTEGQLVNYIEALKKATDFGGKLYIEVANYARDN